MTKILWSIVVVATTLLVLLLIWQFRIAIVLFMLSLATAAALLVSHSDAKPETLTQILPGVWFREGDLEHLGHCNNQIIEMKDYLVVVDANFDRPAVADRLGLASAPGLWDMLGRTIPLAWGFQETGLPNLSALTGGNRFGEPSLDIWPLLLDQLRQRFDWVLIDAADWSDRPDLTALSATAAATYLVLRPADLEMPGLDGLFADIPRRGGRLRGYMVAQR